MFEPCAFRQKMSIMGVDGVKTAAQRCTHVKAEHFTKDVTEDMCVGCVFRMEKIAPKEYARKEEPFPTCEDRIIVAVVPLCCGDSTTQAKCESKTSPMKGLKVNPEVCRGCQHQRLNP